MLSDDQIYDTVYQLRQHYALSDILADIAHYCNTRQPASRCPITELESQGESFAMGSIVAATSVDPSRGKDEVDAMAYVLRYISAHTYVSRYSHYPDRDRELAQGENMVRLRLGEYIAKKYIRPMTTQTCNT